MRGAAEYHQESELGSREVLQNISRGEVDHERCCRKSSGARWIMIGATEDHQERGESR